MRLRTVLNGGFLAVALLALPSCDAAGQRDTAAVRPSIGGSAECTVERIVDGDTFRCTDGSRVRLLLIDADEAGQSAYADSATMLLERVIPPGTTVRLDFDVGLRDRYRRILAYVHADSMFVNRELVRRGLARVVVVQPNVARIEIMRAAADSAREEGLGVWSADASGCTPAAYRARRCR